VLYNCRRRSTQGWSILNILLDFMGGALSLGQQLLTCWWAGNWAPVTANPVKMGLALTSMGMDLVFMVQHYVLYAEKRRPGPCPLSLRRVRSLLRALARAPERLPPDVAEDLLLVLADHGFDVDVPRVLKYYADHPAELPEPALEHLLACYWRVGGAVGIARGSCSSGNLAALGGGNGGGGALGPGSGGGSGAFGGGGRGGGGAGPALGGGWPPQGGGGGGLAGPGPWLAPSPCGSPRWSSPTCAGEGAREPLLALDFFRQPPSRLRSSSAGGFAPGDSAPCSRAGSSLGGSPRAGGGGGGGGGAAALARATWIAAEAGAAGCEPAGAAAAGASAWGGGAGAGEEAELFPGVTTTAAAAAAASGRSSTASGRSAAAGPGRRSPAPAGARRPSLYDDDGDDG
jgi:hypothetical protein